MDDLLVAVGLVLVIEGLLWALAPRFGRRMLEAASEMRESSLRTAGAIAVAGGVFIVWLIRG
ncbi:MAG: DUF2065 domain-containing protein [Pseudomonadota bacterium]